MSPSSADASPPDAAPTASGASWREQKSANAAHQAAELERRRLARTAQARAMIADFVIAAREGRVPTERFTARSYDGRASYRTSVDGWYLRKNRSVGIGEDGEFYVLTVQGSLRALLKGAVLTPSDPPLVLGEGARDGESIDLREALDRALHPQRPA